MGAKLDRSPGKPVTKVDGSTIPGHVFNQDGKHFDGAGNEIVEVEEPTTFKADGVIDIVDKNLDGYINMEEIRKALDKAKVIYHDEMSHAELMDLLKKATKPKSPKAKPQLATKDEEHVCPECMAPFGKKRALEMHRVRMHPSG